MLPCGSVGDAADGTVQAAGGDGRRGKLASVQFGPSVARRFRGPGEVRQIFEEIGMIAPALGLMLVFLVGPFCLSFWTALTNQPLMPRPTPVRFIGLTNFQRVLSDPTFWTALWNVIRFTLMVLPLQCGFAFFMALLLNQKFPLRNLCRAVLFLPAITSMVVVCVIWGTIFQFPAGPLNTILATFSGGWLGPVDWLGDPAWAMVSLVLLSAWHAFGFQMMIYLAALQSIPDELYEAAQMDGAGVAGQFWHVTVPSLWATHVFVLLITTIQALKLFTQVNILTQGGPALSTETVVHYMVQTGFVEQKLGYADAVSVVLFVIILAVALLQRIILRPFDV